VKTLSHSETHASWILTNFILHFFNLIRAKKIPVVPVPDRPYFFLPTLLIFSGWLRAAHTACQNGVCCHTNYWIKLPKFVHRKYASLVNIDVGTQLQIAQQKTAKTMKKIYYFRPTDPNFFTIFKFRFCTNRVTTLYYFGLYPLSFYCAFKFITSKKERIR
jgi:hypothetical protein